MSHATTRRRAGVATACTAALVAALAGCAADPRPTGGEAGSGATASGGQRTTYPLTVQNCDRTLEFAAAPQRVLSLAQPQTDLLAELGVGNRIVGQAQVSEPDGLPGSTRTVAGADIPVLSADGIPSREVMIAQESELVVAPTVFEFDAAEGFATIEELQAAAATPYLATAGCPERRLTRSVEDTLTDIENLGRIFDVQDRAQRVAQPYRETLDEVAAATQGRAPVRLVELFIFGDSIETLAGSSGYDLVRAAGGQNVFTSDIPLFGGKLFATLSPEVIAAQEPQAMLFSVGSKAEADAAVSMLREKFPTTPAVRNDMIIPYSSTASLPGSLTLADAVRHVAQRLHPDAF